MAIAHMWYCVIFTCQELCIAGKRHLQWATLAAGISVSPVQKESISSRTSKEKLQPVSLSPTLAQLMDMQLEPPSLCPLPSPQIKPPLFQTCGWKTLLDPFRLEVHNWKVILVTKRERQLFPSLKQSLRKQSSQNHTASSSLPTCPVKF